MMCLICQQETMNDYLCADCMLQVAVADLMNAWQHVQQLIDQRPWWERRDLADNPHLPVALLHLLADDEDADVAATARYSLSQREN